MADGSLDRMIAAARNVARLAVDGAPEAARTVEAELKASAAAGTSPDGQAWAPRKRDGGRAMAGAASHVTCNAVGTSLVIRLEGPDVFHHFGAGEKPRRPVIPQGTIPDKLGNAIRLGFVEPFRKAVGK